MDEIPELPDDLNPAPVEEKEEIELSEEQWENVKNLWNSRPKNPPTVTELTKAAFPDIPNIDGRSKYGRAVRKKLAEHKIKPPTSGDYQPKEKIELTEEQKEYIKNNSKTSPVKIARVIFDNEALTNLNQEVRCVAEFVRSLGNVNPLDAVNDVPLEREYKSPKTIEASIRLVNKYVNTELDKDKLTGKQKKDLASLQRYMSTFRFVHQMNTFEKANDRQLFESTFVRFTYDKHDLTEEDVDQYFLLSIDAVNTASIWARIEKLRSLLDNIADNDEENKKFAMGLIEAINVAQTEYNQAVKRQQTITNDLRKKRSEREEEERKAGQNLLNLIALWKEEESRKEMIAIANKRNEKTAEAIQQLSDMDILIARIEGLTKDEIFNG